MITKQGRGAGSKKKGTKRTTKKTAKKKAPVKSRAAKKSKKKTRGRPAGSRTKQPQIVETEPSRCKKCGATKRKKYFGTRTVEQTGLRDGKPYNRIIFRRTACENCGQHRVDKSYEFHP